MAEAPYLLDTCAVIWAATGADAPRLRQHLRHAWESGLALWISPITGWEIGNLSASRRLAVARPVLPWIEGILAQSGARLTDLSLTILVAATDLPDEMHRDPADRIIVATAREYGMRVVTRDRRILDYAARGHVMALEC